MVHLTFPLLLRAMRRIPRTFSAMSNRISLRVMLYMNQVKYKSIHSNGMPYFCVAPSGHCEIGQNFSMNNGLRFNPIGFPQPCTIYVGENASLKIGNNVGISQAAIICHCNIEIKDDVKIGGGTRVYDTDFHSITPSCRLHHSTDMQHKKMARVIIGRNAFIGAGSTILKGVEIGENSVIGAGSVVTKCVPPNEIWAGNPAKFIKRIEI